MLHLKSSFDEEKFMEETQKDEGYLFPDTYLFFPNVTTEEITRTLKSNFNKKTESLGGESNKRNTNHGFNFGKRSAQERR